MAEVGDTLFRFKCQCGQTHYVDEPKLPNTKIIIPCRIAPVLLWNGNFFSIVEQVSETARQPFPKGGGWIHHFAIGGKWHNPSLFWGPKGWPIRLGVTVATRIWKRRVKLFGWRPIRGYFDAGAGYGKATSEGRKPTDADFIKEGRREDA